MWSKEALSVYDRTRVTMMSIGSSYYESGNGTKVAVGGLEYSKYNYFAVGTSINQETNDWRNANTRNVFLSMVSRNDITSGANIKWFTSYEEDGDYCASNPYIIKMNNNLFLLLWEEMAGCNEYRNIHQNGKLNYVFLDGEGNVVSQYYTAEGYLSDC